MRCTLCGHFLQVALTKIRVNATCRKCPHKVHRMEMKTAISCTILRHTKILNGGFLHCIQMDTSVNAANQVVSVGADIAFDADPKFFACLVRFESSSVPTTLPTAYDVYPLDGRHDGGYYTVKDCVTIDVLPRTPGNNVYVGFMVWSNFTATKCRGLVSLN